MYIAFALAQWNNILTTASIKACAIGKEIHIHIGDNRVRGFIIKERKGKGKSDLGLKRLDGRETQRQIYESKTIRRATERKGDWRCFAEMDEALKVTYKNVLTVI